MEPAKRGYQFDDAVVDLRNFEVRKGGVALDLEPKSFKVLVFLIENAGRAVSKEELFGAVWQGAFVTDNALTRVVAQLRKALGDNAKQAKYIETIPTLGYRFVADVKPLDVPDVDAPLGAGQLPGVGKPPDGGRPGDRGSSPDGGQRPGSGPLDGGKPFQVWPMATPSGVGRRAAVAAALVVALVAGLAMWRHAGTPSGQFRSSFRSSRLSHPVQFTTSVGLDLNPAFSPDGGAIAYSSDRSGRFEIYVKTAAADGREIQVTEDGAQNLEPAWSPDGRSIAYYCAGRGGIWVVPAGGGLSRQISSFGAAPAWSRDGSAIAFQSNAPASLVPIDLAPNSPTTIWVVSAEGGAPRQVTLPASAPGKHFWPAWSPDGRWIAFVTFSSAHSPQIWAASVNDGRVVPVASGARMYLHPVYAPDQRSIYYASFTEGDDFGIWRLSIDPGGQQPAGRPVDVQRTGLDLPRDFALSPDGKHLAYTLSTMTSDLWSLAVEPSSLEAKSTPVRLTKDTRFRKMHPVFSPDGSRIAFYSQLKGASGDIWVMNANGSDPAPVTRRSAGEYMPSWLPDGKSLVYASHRGGAYNVWLTSLDNGAARPFSNLPDLMGAVHLSPDGRELVFHASKGSVNNIWKRSVETGKLTQLTFDRESMGFPCWSPDAKWIAFEVRRGDSTYLAVMRKDGGEYALLAAERGHSWPFSWSPGGDRIALAGFRDGAWNVWWISRSTRQEKRLTDYRSLRSYVRYPAWSPKGDQIVYEFAETKGNIFLVDLP